MKTSPAPLSILVLGLVVSACSSTAPASQTCAVSGKTYSIGDTFKDDCNTCFCSADGVACTTVACQGLPGGGSPSPSDGGQSGDDGATSCVYQGKTYESSQDIPGTTCANGAGGCFCSVGKVLCYAVACGDVGSIGAAGSTGAGGEPNDGEGGLGGSSCEWKGQSHAVGADLPDSKCKNGAGGCFCTTSGVACYTVACPEDIDGGGAD